MSEAGMVVSGHHKASEAGAAVLRDGGNAIDAAIAASATLAVAIPHMSGLGGDCIALYYHARSNQVIAINGSGAAPTGASASRIRDLGCVARDVAAGVADAHDERAALGQLVDEVGGDEEHGPHAELAQDRRRREQAGRVAVVERDQRAAMGAAILEAVDRAVWPAHWLRYSWPNCVS